MADVAIGSGITAGSFGVVGGVFVLFFFADVPKVRRDIMQVGRLLLLCFPRGITFPDNQQKLPVVGDYFVREIPPSDNVSISCSSMIVDNWLTQCSHSERLDTLQARSYVYNFYQALKVSCIDVRKDDAGNFNTTIHVSLQWFALSHAFLCVSFDLLFQPTRNVRR